MLLGVQSDSNVTRVSGGYGMGLVRSTSFGRKRVALAINGLSLCDDECGAYTSSKRHRIQDSSIVGDKSAFEALPEDLLVRVLCSVDHDDLKTLFFVSKAIRQATVIAKKTHFAYSTPKKTVGFRNAEVFGEFDEVEAPNAPKQSRAPRSRLCAKNLADISLSLFSSDGEEGWSRKDLFA